MTHSAVVGSSDRDAILPQVSWLGDVDLHSYVVADVFAARPLEGNQVAVFLDGRYLSDAVMQDVAREMNFAETVFLLDPADGGDVAVRIFTPRTELPFAG